MSEHRLDRIVIERPRNGMRISSRRIKGHKKELERITREASEDGLLQPYLIKVRNPTKYFSDNLSPLRNWLDSKVGQPWDDVYSKLCRNLDITTLSGQHILSHVWDFVERHVVMIDGVPYRKERQTYPLGGWWERFYVHPETGILCRIPKYKTQKPETRDDIVDVDPYHEYRKLNEIWYFITFENLPLEGKVRDVLLRVELDCDTARNKHGLLMYACHKRNATKKEIKKIKEELGLKGNQS
ncbi:hypothetical protein [Lusitaniella coriacea]|uniref:hypothetical protein n=1 Tax=Lusitaniella coriacea TaxID=1983105 RepID=UPI003CEDE849